MILIEPKPQEPTKHQYDFDVATVYGFLQANGLENEVKVNIEVGHAVLAQPFLRARSLARRGARHPRIGRRQSQRLPVRLGHRPVPQQRAELSLALYAILKAGGLGSGGFNFDAKVRRQSFEPVDLLYAHVGGMDAGARAHRRRG